MRLDLSRSEAARIIAGLRREMAEFGIGAEAEWEQENERIIALLEFALDADETGTQE